MTNEPFSIKSKIKKHKNIFSLLSGTLFAAPMLLEWLFPFTFLGLILLFYTINIDNNLTECKSNNKPQLTFKKKSHFIASIKNRIYSLLSPYLKCLLLFFFGSFITVYTLFLKLYPIGGFDFTKAQNIIIVIFAWIASSIIHSVMGGVILCISKSFIHSPFKYALSCGALWVIFEYSTSLGFLAFPWMNISVSIIKFLPFLQTASLFGNGFITFVVVFSCCCISLFLLCKNKKSFLKVAILTLCANLILGSVLLAIPEDKDKEVSVCIVQGNVSMDERGDRELTDILSQHEKLIRDTLESEKADVVLLAETVFPAVYTKNGLIYQTLSKIAKDYNVSVIFGVILKVDDTSLHNAMLTIYPDGSTSEPYIKRNLVPFGEKLPSFDILGTLVPLLKELRFDIGYIEGTEGKTLTDNNGVVYSPLVCYDSVFANNSRENVLLGGEIIAVSTNDAWYKDGKAVTHHQNHSIIRAIESGRYVFRSANTGISCIISSKGIIKAESEIQVEQTICGKGYTSNRKTLYVLLGNTSLYASFISVIFFIFQEIYKKY